MSAPKLTVREVVAVLRKVLPHAAKWADGGGLYALEQEDVTAAHKVLFRWDIEVEAEEREEHRRALEAAESEAREPW